MKRAFVCLAVSAGILLAGLNSQAQPRRPGGGGGMGSPGAKPEVNAAMMRLFGKNAAFSSKAEMKVVQSGRNVSMTMEMAVLEGKMRSEIDMGNMKGSEMPPQAMAMMKQMGMDKIVSLSLPADDKVYIIYPNLKSYAEMPMPKEEAAAAKKEAKIEKTELGKETVEGHPCVKNKVVITDDENKSHEMLVWNATDLKDFPVKMTMKENGAAIEVLYKDVKFAKPDAKLFEAPKDFKKYESMQQLMMEKMMGGARPPGQ